MVTHDRDEAYQLCDHLLLFSKGHVIAAGKTKDLFNDPGSVEAARLTGCKNVSRIEKIGEVVDGCSLLLEYLTLCTEDGIISAKKAGIWTKKITDVKYPAMKWLKSERGRAESLRQEAEKKRLEMLAKALQVVFAKQEQKTA